MKQAHLSVARSYALGIGDAVANRTINRKVKVAFERPVRFQKFFPRRDETALQKLVDAWAQSEGFKIKHWSVLHGDDSVVQVEAWVEGHDRFESWSEVSARVAYGSSLLEPREEMRSSEEMRSLHHLRQASVLMSGRHLQHGDDTQPTRPMEVFVNCSTSSASFVSFYLLLNGSGVGRAVDDDLMLVDWRKMSIVVPVIDQSHPDVRSGEITAVDFASAEHMYKNSPRVVFEVPDSREGWSDAVQHVEAMTYEGQYRDTVLILDFSKVRPRGAPIKGMQGRPSSGPGPLMNALNRIAKMRDINQAPWRSTMYVDHYLSECVLVGGARRAARMTTKSWRDESAIEFCGIKTGGHLWSSNNSVTVDDEFWRAAKYIANLSSSKPFEVTNEEWLNYLLQESLVNPTEAHAYRVFTAICERSYYDGTGEPGIINQDRLVQNDAGMGVYETGQVLNSTRLTLLPSTLRLYMHLADKLRSAQYAMITNPCGEIPLLSLAGYCTIGDVVPYHAQSDADAEGAFRTATRMLIRTNLMDALYDREVKRTNRIGVGITGLHEYAWKRFEFGFRDLIDEDRSMKFWLMLSRFKRAVVEEAKSYSERLGVITPHTDTTIKPAGTTSKLFGLTEGAHLPSMREYLRYVQFRSDDPLVNHYMALGYPVQRLTSYEGTTIVGFPTRPEICSLGMGDKLVTAGEATPEEQYQYLRLLEKYWIVGVDEDGQSLKDTGNQVSYTLKYDPRKVTFEKFRSTLLHGQSQIKCCSVMPTTSTEESAYEYLPETPVTEEQYHTICAAIKKDEAGMKIIEDVGMEHVDCSSGACPISFNENVAA